MRSRGPVPYAGELPERAVMLLSLARNRPSVRLASGTTPFQFADTVITGRRASMHSIKTKDGTSIFYKNWGSGKPIVFSHGWPLTADA